MMRRARSWLPVVCIGVLGLSFVPPAFAAEGPVFSPPRTFYLALGDSFTYGYQNWKALAGLPPSAFDTGYVDVFADRLRTIRPGITVVNYGCPGESTDTFIAGSCPANEIGFPLHDAFGGTQLDAALDFLDRHPGQVGPITVTLWGNDVRLFIASCGGDLACIVNGAATEIHEIASNLARILGRLRAAAPHAEIIVTGAWNGAIGLFEETDPLYIALNEALTDAARSARARFANPFPVFNSQGDPAEETEAICTYTLECTDGDIHPSDAGYAVIADLVWQASGYARLLE
jgi:lysophospholipase L1-like esterase